MEDNVINTECAVKWKRGWSICSQGESVTLTSTVTALSVLCVQHNCTHDGRQQKCAWVRVKGIERVYITEYDHHTL